MPRREQISSGYALFRKWDEHMQTWQHRRDRGKSSVKHVSRYGGNRDRSELTSFEKGGDALQSKMSSFYLPDLSHCYGFYQEFSGIQEFLSYN
jgi:hypothetical protein